MTHDDEATRKAIASAYSNTWRRENLEEKRAYEREYYAKNRETIRETQRRSRLKNLENNREARAAYQKEYAKNNREAILEHKRRYREKNREKLREANSKYIRDESGAITAKERKHQERNRIQRAVDLQTMAGRPRPEVCDVCGGPPDSSKGMHFDHCHRKGHFRGWLCRGCNLILGYAKDDRSRLLKLVAYLDRTQDGPARQSILPGV